MYDEIVEAEVLGRSEEAIEEVEEIRDAFAE